MGDRTTFQVTQTEFSPQIFLWREPNAIKIQIWVTLIANLQLMVLQKWIKRNWSFSNLATMVRIMLMNYIDCYSFFEHPEKDWLKILDTHDNPPPNLHSLTKGAYYSKKEFATPIDGRCG